MDNFLDFLNFKLFISIPILKTIYYVGAILLPLTVGIILMWLVQKSPTISSFFEKSKKLFWNNLQIKHKIILGIIFICCFLLLETIWRMIFEFLIAYIQIRNSLIGG
ncbi:MAG: DUF4282 domain-containing protein [Desulfonauticus sp.]|nr:DUF4282 domain-containing protein [Desulfonauticus sp.]